jgi:hypothetical protein
VSRATDSIAVAAVYAERHCNDFSCEKCRARYRWARRKEWRTRKPTSRRNRNRKGDAR